MKYRLGSVQQPKALTQTVDDFSGGYNSYVEEADAPINTVVEASNMMIEQNGKWKPRYGTTTYGATLVGQITGAPNEGQDIVYNGTRYIPVIDNGTFKYSTDGGTWTSITTDSLGAAISWSTSVWTEMVQHRNRVYISNGTNNLAYWDLATLTIVQYASLATPTGLSTVKTGLAATTYTYYYRVSAVNTAGETAAAAASSIQVSLQRDSFDTTSNFVTFSWSAVSGATRYNIYIGDQSGYEYYATSVNGISWIDDGSVALNDQIVAPQDNTTTGPKITGIDVIDNRLWGVDSNGAVWFSGAGSQSGTFSSFYGGGYTYIIRGGKETPVRVRSFRDGKGNPLPTVITSTASGEGGAYHIQITSITVGTTIITVPAVYRATGSVGSNAARGIIEALNSLWYPSIKGWTALGSQQSILNVLTPTEMSRAINTDVRNLKQSALAVCTGIYYDSKMLWSVANGSTTNNEVWGISVFQDQNGKQRMSWFGRWTIGVKHFFTYTDSSGETHLLAVPNSGTKLLEFTKNISCYDSGTAFSTRLRSGLIHWDKTHLTWARPEYAYVELSRPRGSVVFKVGGTQKNKAFQTLKSTTITDTTSNVGFSTYFFSDRFFSDITDAPTTFSESSVKKKTKRIGKLLNNWNWEVSSTSGDTDYALIRINMKDAYPEETTDPSNWRS
jgi:hypothetical protein